VSAEFDSLDFGQTVRGFATGQKLFNRYTLKSVLGRGGMGVVWLALDEELDREVALKFLPELLILDRASLDELKRETKRSLELTHHNIVRIYNFAQDNTSACISMEYVDGATLSASRVERENRVFETEEIAPLIQQACEALEYAHFNAKIVHRDLKPTNLMVNSKGTLKITDFGISRSLSDSVTMLTMNRGTTGTLPYMSPQQLDGERVSHLDDIYSLGATIYELLTSKPPFFEGNIDRQVHEKTPSPMAARRQELGIVGKSAIPRNWEETVAACLAKGAADRPQTTKEIWNCLTGASQPPPARRFSSPQIGQEAGEIAQRKNQFKRKSILRRLMTDYPWLLPLTMVLVTIAGVAALVLNMRLRPTKSTSAPTFAPRIETQATPPPAETPQYGRIIVNTIPAGASVFLDGTDQGKSPLIVDNVSPGVHRMTVGAKGYETTSLVADVKAGQTFDQGTLHLVSLATSTVPSATPYAVPVATPVSLKQKYDYRAFVTAHLQKCMNGDIPGIVADYSDSVDYYDNGTVGQAFILKDRQKFSASWPFLSIRLTSEIQADDSYGSGMTVTFNYSFEARSNRRKTSRGQATNRWVLVETPNGLRIATEKQEITNRSGTR
jgi:serine/threonine protein kinase